MIFKIISMLYTSYLLGLPVQFWVEPNILSMELFWMHFSFENSESTLAFSEPQGYFWLFQLSLCCRSGEVPSNRILGNKELLARIVTLCFASFFQSVLSLEHQSILPSIHPSFSHQALAILRPPTECSLPLSGDTQMEYLLTQRRVSQYNYTEQSLQMSRSRAVKGRGNKEKQRHYSLKTILFVIWE